jgi:hypothetical protein
MKPRQEYMLFRTKYKAEEQKLKLFIVRALKSIVFWWMNPSVLLLDEDNGALDFQSEKGV